MIDISYVILTLVAVLNLATPLLIAATGEAVVEKSGALNLGLEGMMLVGALAAYISGSMIDIESCELKNFDESICLLGTASLPIARFFLTICIAGLAGALMSIIFATLVLGFKANQVATGLGITILGLTLTNSLGAGAGDIRVGNIESIVPDFLIDMHLIGPLFSINIMVPIAFLGTILTGVVLSSTRLGITIRAVGENHSSAHTLGYPVNKVRFWCILFGGMMAGIAGGYISMIQIGAPIWREGITSGAGWLALALVLFGSWRPNRIALGALLFGITMALELRLQNITGLPDWVVPLFLPSLPYLIPIIVLVFISLDTDRNRQNKPGCLGKIFHAND